MLHKPVESLWIHGHIVDQDGQEALCHVLVIQGYITYVGEEPPMDRPPGTIYFEPGPEYLIFPGLINLHTHVDYNLLPMWSNHYENQWDNRFEWRGWDVYKQAIADPIHYVREHWGDALGARDQRPNVGVAFQAMSELQAVAGGTTLLQANTDVDDGQAYVPRTHILIRNTGTASDVGLPPDSEVDSQVDFFAPSPKPINALPPQNTSSWSPAPTQGFEDYQARLHNGQIRGTLVHLAEGRSGVGLANEGVDAYSRAEFDAFRETIQNMPPEDVRKTHFSIIHGCGMDAMNPNNVAFLRDYGMGLIWSPVSNMLLYGDTAFAYGLHQAGVDVSLGSDWSPSGSKHVLEEAKYARFFSKVLQLPWSDLDFYRMITSIPAQTLNVPAGQIASQCFGDFYVLRRPNPTMQPLEVLFGCTDADTHAVIVGGVPVYGDPEVFVPWDLTPQDIPESMGQCASSKAVLYPQSTHVDLSVDFEEMVRLFKTQGVDVLSLPLVVDDPYYRDAMQKLRAYTIQYAAQVPENGPSRATAQRLIHSLSNTCYGKA